MFTSILPLLSLALLTSSVSSTPIKRVDDVQCKIVLSGTSIPISEAYGSFEDKTTRWVGLSDDTVTDHNGVQAKYLTVKHSNGEPITRSESSFDFYSCDSKYMNYTTTTDKNTEYYGHITPHVSNPPAKHCVTFASNDLNSTTHTLLTDSICSLKDDSSQLLNFWGFGTYYSEFRFQGEANGAPSHDYYVTISDTGRVHLNPGNAPKGTTVYNFVQPH